MATVFDGVEFIMSGDVVSGLVFADTDIYDAAVGAAAHRRRGAALGARAVAQSYAPDRGGARGGTDDQVTPASANAAHPIDT
jgi:hypothetical protein